MTPPARTGQAAATVLGWKDLLVANENSTETARVEVVVLRRGGEPLLIVPRKSPASAISLKLYPAQTRRARLARALWTSMLRNRIEIGLERDHFVLDLNHPFIKFLEQLAGGPGLPLFALLAGNPRSPGRRFLVLVFSPNGQPAAVVKVGADRLAADLIEKEIAFLDSVDPTTAGIPRLGRRFAQGEWRAFALDFIDGDSPRSRQCRGLAPLLSSWLSQEPAQPPTNIPAWQRLARKCADDPLFTRIANEVQSQPVRTAIFHGDFAPWNVKVSSSSGSWTVLDWDRGEAVGPPAWDWFHFVIQAAILAKKQSGATLTRTALSLLASEPFRNYAREAGLADREHAWLLAYLLHCRDVLGQNQILPEIPELIARLSPQTPVGS